MQVINIQPMPIQVTSQKKSFKDEPVGFLDALSSKLDQVKKAKDTEATEATKVTEVASQPQEDVEEKDIPTVQVVEIPITQAMLPLMTVFTEQAEKTSIDAIATVVEQTAVPVSLVENEAVSPNTATILTEDNTQDFQQIDKTTHPQIDISKMEAVKTADIQESTKLTEPPVTQNEQVANQTAKSPEAVQISASTDGTAILKADTEETKPVQAQVLDTDAGNEVKVEQVKTNQASGSDEKPQDNNSDDKSKALEDVGGFELKLNKNLVKISDASSKLDAPKVQTPQSQLVDTIKTNLNNGRTEFEMQLTPVNLGKITVKMVSENGMLTVEFRADNPKTQSMLMSSAGEIKDLIQGTLTSQTQVITPNHSEGMPQNYTQQQKGQENNQQQQQNQNQNQQQNQQENTETSTIDFLTVLQQLKEQSRLTRV